MVENPNDFPDKLKQKYTEIYAEIREIINGTGSIDALKRQGALSPKLRKLITLGSAIATKRGRDKLGLFYIVHSSLFVVHCLLFVVIILCFY